MSESNLDVDTQPGDELLAELADDFLRRYRAGEHPSVDEYAKKHPALADRIPDLFAAVIALEQPGGSPTLEFRAAEERVGEMIGRYKLLERIGEGGFGVVYVAEQQNPVRRKVALKVIKPGMDTRQVVARFEAERQALAIMDHPNIAKVHDAGATTSGRPFFVMELVKGAPITEFCDANQLTPRQRLELFVPVCQAVQHAHHKGIVHRDLKPSNVLVTMHDTTPVVKVIDFGVAKALGQELTDKTLYTGFAEMIGTPLYMSPEQAGQSGLDIDTRSDIYSLGVLLYELLTGTTPFTKERFKQAAGDEIRRIIREEDPPKPSTRLSHLSSAEQVPRLPTASSLASISAQRHTEPAKLVKLMRGEPDWIVMKALEKDRNRRYETASAFASDVERYLTDEPVQAGPPSSAYRLKKFMRRNKAAFAVAGLTLFFLTVLGSGVGWTVRERAARHAKFQGQVESILAQVDRLEREQKWAEALAVARRAEAAVTSGDSDALTTQLVHQRLKDLEFIDQLDQIRMQRAAMVEGSTLTDGEISYARADRKYAQAFRDYGVDVENLPVETATDRLKARTRYVIPLAAALDDWVYTQHKIPGRQAKTWKRLIPVARAIDPEPLRDRLRSAWERPISQTKAELRGLAESIDIRAHPPATLVMMAYTLNQGDVLSRRISRGYIRSDLEKGTPGAFSALRLLSDAQLVYPGDFWLNFQLGSALSHQKDYERAARFYTAALSIRPNSVAACYNLGNALRAQKKVDEAIACYRQAIELNSDFTRAHLDLGWELRSQGKLDEAVATYRNVIELNPDSDILYIRLGDVLIDQQKPDEAIAAYNKVIERNPENAIAYSKLGCTYALWGNWKQASANYVRALETGFANHNDWSHAATVYLVAGDVDKYRSTCREIIERFGQTNSAVIAEQTAKTCSLAPEATSDFRRVEALAQRAVTGTEKHLYYRLFVLANGLTLYRAGRYEQAVEWLHRYSPSGDGVHFDAIAFAGLAMAQHKLARTEEAKKSLAKAKAIVETKMPDPTKGRPFHYLDWNDWLHAQILSREAQQMIAH